MNKTTKSLGPLHADYDIEGIDIHPTTRILYAAAGSDNRFDQDGYLYMVDGQTGELTPVGSTSFSEIVGLSFRPDSILWGWSEGARLIRIDTTTGAERLIFAASRNIEGLAWNNDSSLLYGASGTSLWVYTPGNNTLKRVATNLPGSTEALEMRPDGLLMGRVDGSGAINIFAYDPHRLQVVASATITTPYDDVESIAWPEKCGIPPWLTSIHAHTDILTSSSTVTATATPTATPIGTPSATLDSAHELRWLHHDGRPDTITTSQGTNIAVGITVAAAELTNYCKRPTTSVVIIVLSDGRSNCSDPPHVAATMANAHGIRMI